MPSRHWYQGSWWASLVSQKKGKNESTVIWTSWINTKHNLKIFLNVFGKIHFTLLVIHTKLILNRNVTFFAVSCFAYKALLQQFVEYLFINWSLTLSCPFFFLFFFGSSTKQGKKISFGCFTNLGYDEVGKLGSS